MTAALIQRAGISEPDLIATIAAGDLSGLGLLFDRYGVDVRRFLSRVGIDANDLDDVLQETFIDVVRASGAFRRDAPVKPWLFGIATMVARRHRRLVHRLLARVRRWAAERVDDPVATPDEDLELHAEAARARRALDAISARKREVFVLVALEGLSGEEAAAALRIPIGTVWTRLHHARRELRRALE
jgi:RNA polymerase sigma-70 factor (ECF subfamily)